MSMGFLMEVSLHFNLSGTCSGLSCTCMPHVMCMTSVTCKYVMCQACVSLSSICTMHCITTWLYSTVFVLQSNADISFQNNGFLL